MSSLILIVDDGLGIKSLVDSIVQGALIDVVGTVDVSEAKRKLIQQKPTVVLTRVHFSNDPEAGLRFCGELCNHPELSSVPLIFLETCEDESLQARALEIGAESFICWPISEVALRHKLASLIPVLRQNKESSIASQAATASAKTSLAPRPSVASRSESDEKMRIAQNLLAKVLHNLKTSDLLQVVETEDVPRVVFEITRSVCGIQAQSSKPESLQEEKQTAVDLASAFQLKK